MPKEPRTPGSGRIRLFLLIAAAFFCLLLPDQPATAAGAPRAIGPSAGGMFCAVPSPWQPGGWYFGTECGVFRRAEGDSAWSLSSSGLPVSNVTSMAASPHRPGLLLCGQGSGGIFRSQDSGQNWLPANSGVEGRSIMALAADPQTIGTFYAATGSGLLRTTDFGGTWAPRGLDGLGLVDIECDPGHAGRAWAVEYGEGVYRTTDSGLNWVLSSDGLPGPFIWIDDIRAAAGGDTVFVAGRHLCRSIDGGAHWSELGAGSLPYYSAYSTVALPAGNARCILVAETSVPPVSTVYGSTDGGLSWADLRPPVEDEDGLMSSLRVFASSDGSRRVLAGAHDGELFLGSNAGESWTLWWQGISSGTITAVDVQGSRWIAGGPWGPYVSENAGRSWKKSRGGDEYYQLGHDVSEIAISPVDPMIAWCAVSTHALWECAILKSTDGGHTWYLSLSNPTASDAAMSGVAVDPSDPQCAYAAYNGDTGQVYFTRNGGLDWLGAPPFGQFGVFSLLVDPWNPDIVLAGTGGGVCRSTDRGVSWSPPLDPGMIVLDLSPDGQTPGRVYAATANNGVLVSADDGVTWSPLGDGLPSRVRAVNGTSAEVGLLAGTEQGIWQFDGTYWTPLPSDEQPYSLDVTDLRVLPGTDGFLAATSRAGMAYYPSRPSAVENAPFVRPDDLRILGSPSSGPFTLQWSSLRSGPGRLEIFDAVGRLVRMQDLATTGHGLTEWRWDGRNTGGVPVASGVYWVRFVNGASGATRARVCVVR